MKLILTNFEQINHKRCDNKGCPNKAEGIINRKYYCKECFEQIKPRKYTYLKSMLYRR